MVVEMVKNDMEADVLQLQTVTVDGRTVRVGIRPGNPAKTPLLIFNGIGANIELLVPFVNALADIEVVTFDIPGVGESPAPMFPYHMATMSVLANRLLTQLGYDQVDVMGVSWGGALAQEFAHLYANRCRQLILAATSPGIVMMPGKLSVLSKMMGSRRYTDPGYMAEIGGEIYGGDFRHDPYLIQEHASHLRRPNMYGYLYQLLAIMNWSSLLWLRTLEMPTLVIHGDDDPIVPVTNAAIIATQIPNAKLHVVNDGHLFIVSRVKETADTVLDFLHGTPS
jgi:poly(3-hydroxyalkanoate) depolymerase